jgi:hypothetical protein
MFIWTPARQDLWNYLVAQNQPDYWGRIHNKATRDDISDDYGQWRALAYQMTDDAAYAQSAMVKVRQAFVDARSDGNLIRDKFVRLAWCYDFLYPGLTANERAEFMTGLKAWATDTVASQTECRLGDTDENTARFFGLAMLDQLTAAEGNPTNYLSGNFIDQIQGSLPVGGLDPDSNPAPVTWRKWMQHMAQMASGGEWLEGTEYSLDTDVYWLVGIESLKTATGAEHFPEFRALVDPVARRFLAGLTPDGLPVSFEDLQDPRINVQPRTLNAFGSFAALTSDSTIAAGLQYVVNGMFLTSENLPTVEFYLFNDPRSASQNPTTAAPLVHFADGQNVLFFHTGYTSNDTLFTVQMFPFNFVDHDPPSDGLIDHYPSFFSDFQMYRKGVWALARPLGYSASFAAAANDMLIEGNNMAWPTKQRVAYEASPGVYAYIAGLNSGWPDAGSYPDPPYLAEWTRSMVYLPSSNQQSDAIVIHDRINSKDMRTMPNYSTYNYNSVRGLEEDIAANIATRSRREWIIHTPVNPTVSQPTGAPAQIEWIVDSTSGQTGRVTILVPTSPRTQVYDETQLWSALANYQISLTDRKWQARVMPPTEQDWQTMLNIVQVYDNGFTPDNALLRSTDGMVEGALVKRAGLDDLLVMFSANLAQRLLRQGCAFSWTAAGANTQLFLPDLDAGLKWTASIDGGVAQPLTVSGQGMGQMSVAAAGAHTVILAAVGPAPDAGM